MVEQIATQFKHKDHFYLKKECILRRGKSDYAIYNIFNGDLISLEDEIGSVLEMAEGGNSIDEIAKHRRKDTASVINILQKVKNWGFGDYFSKRIYIEKYREGRLANITVFDIPVINKCYIELPSSCSRDCTFCGYPTLFPCITCTKVKGNLDEPSLKQILHRIIQMQCNSLVIHGGDPIINMPQLISIIEFCRKEGFANRISIITNGNLIDNSVMESLKKYSIHLIIPFFPASKMGSNYEEITYYKNIIELLHYYDVSFEATKVTLESTPDAPNSFLGVDHKPQNFVSAAIYDGDISQKKGKYPKLLDTCLRVKANVYYHNINHHPCLDGTLAITTEGNILPCPHLRNEILGTYHDPRIIDTIFKNRRIFDYWDLPLSAIDECRDCEFQYGCMDCRAIEARLTGNIHGKKLCTFSKIENKDLIQNVTTGEEQFIQCNLDRQKKK